MASHLNQRGPLEGRTIDNGDCAFSPQADRNISGGELGDCVREGSDSGRGQNLVVNVIDAEQSFALVAGDPGDASRVERETGGQDTLFQQKLSPVFQVPLAKADHVNGGIARGSEQQLSLAIVGESVPSARNVHVRRNFVCLLVVYLQVSIVPARVRAD